MARSPLFATLVRALGAARRRQHAERGLAPPRRLAAGAISRRRLLARLGAGAALGALPWPTRPARAQSRPEIAIVGAGLAGLAAAWTLAEAGYPVTVYEGRNRVGGRMLSLTDRLGDGLTVDVGGSFVNTDHEDLIGLAETLGVPLAQRRAAAKDGPPASAFLFDGPWPEAALAAALAPLAAQIGADAALLDADWDQHLPAFDGLSVADYLDRHTALIGDARVRRFVETGIRTEYGVEPAQSSAVQLLFNLPVIEGEAVEPLGNSDEALTFRDGAQALADALAARLEGRIRLGTIVDGVAVDDRTVAIALGGDLGEARADYVILAIPPTVLRLIEIRTQLPPDFRALIAEQALGLNEKLILATRGRPWLESGSFALDLWTDGAFAAAWDETTRQPDAAAAALTLFHGGAAQCGPLLEGTEADLTAQRLRTLEPVVPGILGAWTGRSLRSRWAADRFTGGAYTTFAPGGFGRAAPWLWVEGEDGAPAQGPVFGRLLFAGEHFSDAHYGYMNGAAETGRLAARALRHAVEG